MMPVAPTDRKNVMSRHSAHTQRHVNDLLEVLNELLTVPELACFEPDEMFDHTLEVMAKARTIRAAVLDELAELEGRRHRLVPQVAAISTAPGGRSRFRWCAVSRQLRAGQCRRRNNPTSGGRHLPRPQHFITHSSWAVRPFWQALRALLPVRHGILAIDDTGFPSVTAFSSAPLIRRPSSAIFSVSEERGT